MELATQPMMVIFIFQQSLVYRLPWFRSVWAEMVRLNAVGDRFFNEQITQHTQELEEMCGGGMDAAPTDFVHAFLKEKAKRDAEEEDEQLDGQQCDVKQSQS